MLQGLNLVGNVGHQAWHRRNRCVRVAARRVVASPASFLRANADIPNLLLTALSRSAANLSGHYGSAVPAVVGKFLEDMGDEYWQKQRSKPKHQQMNSSNKPPGKGWRGRQFVLCGRGECKHRVHLCNICTAYCGCGCRWSNAVLAAAKEVGA